MTSTPSPHSKLGNRCTIQLAVRLNARAPDRRTLAAIEHPPVDRRAVGGARHQAVEHVELADEMSFTDAANRRVARHLAGIFGPEG